MDSNSNTKAKDILYAARELFWKYGIKRVTVEEICQKAGASKMTFYREFNNKIDVAKAVLKEFTDESRKKYRAMMDDPSLSFYEKMKKSMLMKAEASENISREFISDIMINRHSELQEYMDEIRCDFWKEVKADYKKAQDEGFLRKDLNLDFFLIFSTKAMPLFEDEELKRLYPDPKDMIMELTKIFVFGMVEHDPK